jgi:hypothetical protein
MLSTTSANSANRQPSHLNQLFSLRAWHSFLQTIPTSHFTMPTALAKVKTAALSKELSEPLPEPPTFEGKPGVRSIAGDLGDQYVYPSHTQIFLHADLRADESRTKSSSLQAPTR